MSSSSELFVIFRWAVDVVGGDSGLYDNSHSGRLSEMVEIWSFISTLTFSASTSCSITTFHDFISVFTRN
jgi:hypothetical protein